MENPNRHANFALRPNGIAINSVLNPPFVSNITKPKDLLRAKPILCKNPAKLQSFGVKPVRPLKVYSIAQLF